MSALTESLMREILGRYRLPYHGIHGLYHWARVREIGLRLAERTGGRPDVVELFAVFHDACRRDEGMDQGHGPRAARLVEAVAEDHLGWLDPEGRDLLKQACRQHTFGRTEGDVTVRTCWDADRLDLGRIGIRPRPDLLCTEAARDPEILDWADGNARREMIPAVVSEQWLGWLRGG